MIRSCFVILHYLSIENTVECVNSVLALQGFEEENAQIVIVDNASNNNTGQMLKEQYAKNGYIHVILNKNNEGFARGNNVGYSFAREVLKADLILVLNNDLIIEEKDFLKKAKELINKCDVLGPDIYNESSFRHQNPQQITRDYRKALYKYKVIKMFYTLYPFKNVDIVYSWFKRNFIKEDKGYAIAPKKQFGVQLHGACIIFGRNFVKNEKQAFDPRTFLYLEEDFLYRYCKKKNYVILYDPSIRVIHRGSVSTKASELNERQRKINNLSYHIQSTSIMIDDLKQEEKQ